MYPFVDAERSIATVVIHAKLLANGAEIIASEIVEGRLGYELNGATIDLSVDLPAVKIGKEIIYYLDGQAVLYSEENAVVHYRKLCQLSAIPKPEP